MNALHGLAALGAAVFLKDFINRKRAFCVYRKDFVDECEPDCNCDEGVPSLCFDNVNEAYESLDSMVLSGKISLDPGFLCRFHPHDEEGFNFVHEKLRGLPPRPKRTGKFAKLKVGEVNRCLDVEEEKRGGIIEVKGRDPGDPFKLP
jgi:hypothetical protein